MTILNWFIQCGGLGLTWLCLSTAIVAGDPDVGPVVVCLADSVLIESGLVTLADLVVPEQAAAGLSPELSRLDVLQRAPDEQQEVTREFIELRLRLAGYSADDVLLVGPERVQLHSAGSMPPEATAAVSTPQAAVPTAEGAAMSSQWSEVELESAAAAAIAQQLGVAVEDLRVTLATPVPDELRTTSANPRRCEVIPLGDRLLGRVNCRFRLPAGGQSARSFNLAVLVEKRCPVLVVSRTLERGVPVTAETLRQEVRFLTEAVDELTISMVSGRRPRTTVRPGEILCCRHLEPDKPPVSETVVQPRQLVEVTAAKPGLRVRLRQGQALDGGRIGDQIRVRNDDSGRVISGRVTGAGQVEIALP